MTDIPTAALASTLRTLARRHDSAVDPRLHARAAALRAEADDLEAWPLVDTAEFERVCVRWRMVPPAANSDRSVWL